MEVELEEGEEYASPAPPPPQVSPRRPHGMGPEGSGLAPQRGRGRPRHRSPRRHGSGGQQAQGAPFTGAADPADPAASPPTSTSTCNSRTQYGSTMSSHEEGHSPRGTGGTSGAGNRSAARRTTGGLPRLLPPPPPLHMHPSTASLALATTSSPAAGSSSASSYYHAAAAAAAAAGVTAAIQHPLAVSAGAGPAGVSPYHHAGGLMLLPSPSSHVHPHLMSPVGGAGGGYAPHPFTAAVGAGGAVLESPAGLVLLPPGSTLPAAVSASDAGGGAHHHFGMAAHLGAGGEGGPHAAHGMVNMIPVMALTPAAYHHHPGAVAVSAAYHHHSMTSPPSSMETTPGALTIAAATTVGSSVGIWSPARGVMTSSVPPPAHDERYPGSLHDFGGTHHSSSRPDDVRGHGVENDINVASEDGLTSRVSEHQQINDDDGTNSRQQEYPLIESASLNGEAVLAVDHVEEAAAPALNLTSSQNVSCNSGIGDAGSFPEQPEGAENLSLAKQYDESGGCKMPTPPPFAPEFRCEVCSFVTKRKDGLRRHVLRSHADVRPYACFVCAKPFSRTDHLKVHFVRNHKEVPYDLQRCKVAPPAQVASAGTSGSGNNGGTSGPSGFSGAKNSGSGAGGSQRSSGCGASSAADATGSVVDLTMPSSQHKQSLAELGIDTSTAEQDLLSADGVIADGAVKMDEDPPWPTDKPPPTAKEKQPPLDGDAGGLDGELGASSSGAATEKVSPKKRQNRCHRKQELRFRHGKSFGCPICEYFSYDSWHLKRHMKTHLANTEDALGMVPCPVAGCPVSTQLESFLLNHMLKDHAAKPTASTAGQHGFGPGARKVKAAAGAGGEDSGAPGGSGGSAAAAVGSRGNLTNGGLLGPSDEEGEGKTVRTLEKLEKLKGHSVGLNPIGERWSTTAARNVPIFLDSGFPTLLSTGQMTTRRHPHLQEEDEDVEPGVSAGSGSARGKDGGVLGANSFLLLADDDVHSSCGGVADQDIEELFTLAEARHAQLSSAFDPSSRQRPGELEEVSLETSAGTAEKRNLGLAAEDLSEVNGHRVDEQENGATVPPPVEADVAGDDQTVAAVSLLPRSQLSGTDNLPVSHEVCGKRGVVSKSMVTAPLADGRAPPGQVKKLKKRAKKNRFPADGPPRLNADGTSCPTRGGKESYTPASLGYRCTACDFTGPTRSLVALRKRHSCPSAIKHHKTSANHRNPKSTGHGAGVEDELSRIDGHDEVDEEADIEIMPPAALVHGDESEAEPELSCPHCPLRVTHLSKAETSAHWYAKHPAEMLAADLTAFLRANPAYYDSWKVGGLQCLLCGWFCISRATMWGHLAGLHPGDPRVGPLFHPTCPTTNPPAGGGSSSISQLVTSGQEVEPGGAGTGSGSEGPPVVDRASRPGKSPRQHHPKKPPSSYNRYSTLYRHRVIEALELYYCALCCITYRTKVGCAKHVASEHGGRVKLRSLVHAKHPELDEGEMDDLGDEVQVVGGSSGGGPHPPAAPIVTLDDDVDGGGPLHPPKLIIDLEEDSGKMYCDDVVGRSDKPVDNHDDPPPPAGRDGGRVVRLDDSDEDVPLDEEHGLGCASDSESDCPVPGEGIRDLREGLKRRAENPVSTNHDESSQSLSFGRGGFSEEKTKASLAKNAKPASAACWPSAKRLCQGGGGGNSSLFSTTSLVGRKFPPPPSHNNISTIIKTGGGDEKRLMVAGGGYRSKNWHAPPRFPNNTNNKTGKMVMTTASSITRTAPKSFTSPQEYEEDPGYEASGDSDYDEETGVMFLLPTAPAPSPPPSHRSRFGGFGFGGPPAGAHMLRGARGRKRTIHATATTGAVRVPPAGGMGFVDPRSACLVGGGPGPGGGLGGFGAGLEEKAGPPSSILPPHPGLDIRRHILSSFRQRPSRYACSGLLRNTLPKLRSI